MTQLDEVLESIAQRGCLEVNQILSRLNEGKVPDALSDLSESDRQYIHQELSSVMAVYDGGVCSV